MKKLLSILFAVVLAVGLFFLLPDRADAATSGLYTYEISNDQAEITKCSQSASGSITIPANLGGYPVTSIGENTFFSCTYLTSITIPEGVTKIGQGAFYGCSKLTSLSLPNSLTELEDSFINCPKLQYNAFENVYYLGNSENPYLVLVAKNSSPTVPRSLHPDTKIICNYAFAGKGTPSTIIIPDGVISIGLSAFENCGTLRSITIPDSVTSIGARAFYRCFSLSSIVLPDYLTSIEANTFYGCKNLTSITVPRHVTNIGNNAFYNCSGLETVIYQGTKTDWNNIQIDDKNDPLLNATILYDFVGDVNGDDEITDTDAIYLLYHIFYPEEYPISQECDFNGDGELTDADAIYLLYYTFYPEEYPLALPPKKED